MSSHYLNNLLPQSVGIAINKDEETSLKKIADALFVLKTAVEIKDLSSISLHSKDIGKLTKLLHSHESLNYHISVN